MKRIGWKWSTLAASLIVIGLIAQPAISRAQAAGSIHGHVINPAGAAVNKGEVKLTQDRAADEKQRKYLYTFELDANGDYKGSGIAPDSYLVIVFQDAIDSKMPARKIKACIIAPLK